MTTKYFYNALHKYFYNALHKDFKQRVTKNTERTLFMSNSGSTSGVSLGCDFLSNNDRKHF